MSRPRTVTFTQAARQELIEAHNWYERESPGLGHQFRTAIEKAVERIGADPLQFPVVHRNIRRALLRRFPYALMFVIEADDSLTVIACFHGSRNPMRWEHPM